MAARPLALRVQRSYICPSCHTSQSRHLSTTARLSAISPESPRYIDVPQPPQQTYTPPKRMKGILPVPRDVMRHRKPADVEASIPDPSRHAEASNERSRFTISMTNLRKSNLRSGAAALLTRRETAISTARAHARTGRAKRDAALNAPEHFSDRLTSQTLDASVAAELARYAAKQPALPDPKRGKRLAAARGKVAAAEEKARRRRMDGLHTLYMNARSFIVDEKGLNAAIDQAFGTVDAPVWGGDSVPSMWKGGPPPKMNDMADRAGAGGGVLASSASGEAEVLKDRVKRIAERLTGGKMDG